MCRWTTPRACTWLIRPAGTAPISCSFPTVKRALKFSMKTGTSYGARLQRRRRTRRPQLRLKREIGWPRPSNLRLLFSAASSSRCPRSFRIGGAAIGGDREEISMGSPQLQQVFEQYRAFAQAAGKAKDPQELRATMASAFSAFPSAGEVTCQPVSAGGVKAEWIVAKNAAPDRVIMYLHGGGYVMGSIATHREVVARL